MNDAKIVEFSVRGKSLPWSDRDFYAAWMAQIYFLTTHSVPMLHKAAQYTDRPEYKARLEAQVREEGGHDKMALSDLKQLGHKIENYEEFSVTRALWESVLYKCQHTPDALVGYIYALELAAVDLYGHTYPLCAKEFGEKTVKFMRVHALEDQEHVIEARKHLDALSAESRHQANIAAMQAVEMLECMIAQILATYKTKRHEQAA